MERAAHRQWDGASAGFLHCAAKGGELLLFPGYGDLPLSCQQPLLSALRAMQTLGMTVNSGGLLSPNKSVTAIIGVRDTPATQTLSPCDACLKRGNCEFRRRNQVCYRSKQG